MIGQIEDLKQTALFAELDRRAGADPLAAEYKALIESSFPRLHKYLDDIRRYFLHFTDHCITHSIRIIHRISSFLAPDQLHRLTSAELYLLIAGPLVHDIGMVTPESEAVRLAAELGKDQQLKNALEASFATTGGATNDWYIGGIGRLVVADFVRRKHGQRARLVVNSSLLPIILLTADDQARKDWLGRIAEAHTLDFDTVANPTFLPTDILLDERRVNCRFVAICLRLGDLLDINTSRVCPMIRQLSEPLPYASQAHWDQYIGVRLHESRYGTDVTVSGTCHSQDAHRLLKEWLRWLSDELSNAVALLNTSAIRDPQYVITLGRVVDLVEPALGPNGLPEYELLDFRFNLDEERIFERLFGERLYGRSDLAIRELVQNAVDATKHRVIYELSTQAPTAHDKRDNLKEAIDLRRDELALTIRVRRSKSDKGVATEYLEIEDAGIGMSRQVIRDYLLKVGRSRWSEDKAVKEYSDISTGEFGIGFLSTFMLADRITIETRSAVPDEAAVRATVFSWKSYLATEPLEKPTVGTRIILTLKPGALRSLGRRLKALEKWCPLIDLPITIELPGTTVRQLPGRRRARLWETNTGRTFFPLNSSGGRDNGSLGSVSGSADGFADDRSMCQDGLTVPDVPPPGLRDPMHSVLRDAAVVVDLRGTDRWPLDLSRNLIRGESRAVWDKLVPTLWSSLIYSGALRYAVPRQVLARYATLEFASFGKDSRLLVCPRAGFRSLSTNDCEVIGLVDAASADIAGAFEDTNAGWVVLGDPNEVSNLWQFGSKSLGRIRVERDISMVRKPPWMEPEWMQTAMFEYALIPTWDVFNSVFGEIRRSHPFIDLHESDARTVFVRSSSVRSRKIDDLGFVRMSKEWVSLRSASSEGWLNIPYGYIADLVVFCEQRQSKWEEFLFALLYFTDTDYMAWGGWWERRDPQFKRVAERVLDCHAKRMAHIQRGADDKGGRMSLAEWEEQRRREASEDSDARETHLSEECEWLFKRVRRFISLEVFGRASTQWDKDAWNDRTFAQESSVD